MVDKVKPHSLVPRTERMLYSVMNHPATNSLFPVRCAHPQRVDNREFSRGSLGVPISRQVPLIGRLIHHHGSCNPPANFCHVKLTGGNRAAQITFTRGHASCPTGMIRLFFQILRQLVIKCLHGLVIRIHRRAYTCIHAHHLTQPPPQRQCKTAPDCGMQRGRSKRTYRCEIKPWAHLSVRERGQAEQKPYPDSWEAPRPRYWQAHAAAECPSPGSAQNRPRNRSANRLRP